MAKKTDGEICPFCGSEYTEVEEREVDLGAQCKWRVANVFI